MQWLSHSASNVLRHPGHIQGSDTRRARFRPLALAVNWNADRGVGGSNDGMRAAVAGELPINVTLAADMDTILDQ